MSATVQSSHHQNASSSVSNSRPAPRSSSRNRSAADPFLDDNNHHLHNRQKQKQFSIRPPEPLPKHSYNMSATTAAAPKQQIPRDIDQAALRDTVTVSHPRKFSRSHTTAPPPSRPSQSSRQRSHSQDSVTQAAAAVERSKNKTGRPKKGSQHADVIDRLDFTGVGPMFHHDGPFDACAPSRNRHRTKAPMLAWSSTPNDPIITSSAQYIEASPYPTPEVYKNTFSDNYYDVPKKKVDAIAEAWGIHEPEPFEDFSAGGGSGRPEGDTPNGSIYNGRDGQSRTANGAAAPKRSKDGRDLREVYREYLDGGIQQPSRQTTGTNKRTPLPPPQPIFVPDANHPDLIDGPASAPLSSPPLTPKRNKSLMQRIRKMRDAPNVPVAPGGDYETIEPPSPSSSLENSNSGYPVASPVRPTHRPQNSFLGRFGGGDRDRGGSGAAWGGGRGGGNPKENISPTSDTLDRGKDLPATPQANGYGSATPTPLAEHESRGYFDNEYHEASNGYNTSPGPGGIGRKTSMLRKVKGVVAKGGK